MNVEISFAELSEYVKTHYGKSLTFEGVSDKELRVVYAQRVLIRDVKVPVNIIIDEVQPNSVQIAYKGGLGVDMLVGGVLSFLKSYKPEIEAMLVQEPGHHIRILLSALPNAEKILQIATLSDISLSDSALRISLTLK